MPSYQVISADARLELDPARWEHRVPAEHRVRLPRQVALPSGGDAWLVEGQPLRVCGLEIGGRPTDEIDVTGASLDGSPGSGSPEQRLAEQDRDGIDAEVLFPGIAGPALCNLIPNRTSYAAIVHGYNQFLAEEYCATDPDRLIGVGVIPETGVAEAVAELHYCADAGLKAIMLNAFPTGLSYPSPADEQFWSATLDRQMAVTAFRGFNYLPGGKRTNFKFKKQPTIELSPGSRDPIRRIGGYALGNSFCVVQMVMDGLFERYPALRFYLADGHAGWVPHFMEQTDQLYDRNIHWAKDFFGLEPLKEFPSRYVRRHVAWGIADEAFAIRWRDEIGLENLMWSNRFPHTDGSWPRSKEVIDRTLDGVADDERHAIICGNAARFFGLPES